MAKDDYYVIVYQILYYLYQRFKKGEQVNTFMLNYDSPLFETIDRRQWAYIIYLMSKMGLIEGIDFVEKDVPYPIMLDDCRITLHGINYLCGNSTMKRARQSLKGIKEIVPFESIDKLTSK